MELKKAITLFLGEYKESTRTAYLYILAAMQDYLGPARPVAAIRDIEVLQYVQESVRQRGYADATVNKHLKTIKTFFYWLVRVKELERAPVEGIRQKRINRHVGEDKAMTDDELAAILAVVNDPTVEGCYKPRDYALILFLADTGCRAGGAAGLKIHDLDLLHKRATVLEKGEKQYTVFFGDQCRDAVSHWLEYRQVDHPVIFLKSGEKLTSATVSQIVRRACLKAGVRSLGAHSLRHRKGFQMADAGVPVTVAATVFNHADSVTTQHSYYPRDVVRAEQVSRKLHYSDRAGERNKIIQLPKSGDAG